MNNKTLISTIFGTIITFMLLLTPSLAQVVTVNSDSPESTNGVRDGYQDKVWYVSNGVDPGDYFIFVRNDNTSTGGSFMEYYSSPDGVTWSGRTLIDQEGPAGTACGTGNEGDNIDVAFNGTNFILLGRKGDCVIAGEIPRFVIMSYDGTGVLINDGSFLGVASNYLRAGTIESVSNALYPTSSISRVGGTDRNAVWRLLNGVLSTPISISSTAVDGGRISCYNTTQCIVINSHSSATALVGNTYNPTSNTVTSTVGIGLTGTEALDPQLLNNGTSIIVLQDTGNSSNTRAVYRSPSGVWSTSSYNVIDLGAFGTSGESFKRNLTAIHDNSTTLETVILLHVNQTGIWQTNFTLNGSWGQTTQILSRVSGKSEISTMKYVGNNGTHKIIPIAWKEGTSLMFFEYAYIPIAQQVHDITFTNPEVNKDNFYIGVDTQIISNITVLNITTNTTVGNTYFEWFFLNYTGHKVANPPSGFNGGTYSFNSTSIPTTDGTYEIRQFAEITELSENRTDDSSYTSVEVLAGINVSVRNFNNQTPIPNFGVSIINGTNSTFISIGLTGEQFYRYNTIPQGDVNITVFANGYQNASRTINNNNTAFSDLTLEPVRLQQWKGIGPDGPVQFSITLSNGTFNVTKSSNGAGLLLAPLNELPFGTTVAANFSSILFVAQSKSYNINSSTEINETITFVLSGIIFEVKDEDSQEFVNQFKFTMTNSSDTTYITVGKSSTLPFLDDNSNTFLNNSVSNYTYAFGYTVANFSIDFELGATTDSINISIFDPITATFIPLYNVTGITGRHTQFFTANNTGNPFGDFSLFNINMAGGTARTYEVQLVSPYTYNKNGQTVINFAGFGLLQGETRIVLTSPFLYPNVQRTYFITASTTTQTTLTSYLSNFCYFQSYNVVSTGTFSNPPISNALVTIFRIFENEGRVIAQERSNSLGDLSICIEQGFPYNIQVSANGFNTFNANQQTFFNIGQTTQIFLSPISTSNFTNPLQGATINITPNLFYVSNSEPQNFTCTAIATNNNFNFIHFTVYNTSIGNGTVIQPPIFTDVISSPSGGSILSTINQTGRFDLVCGYQLTQNSTIYNINKTNTVFYYENKGLAGAGEGLVGAISPNTILLIGLVITMMVAGFFTKFFGVTGAFIFMILYTFIFFIFGAWGFNIETGALILAILIWIALIMYTRGI